MMHSFLVALALLAFTAAEAPPPAQPGPIDTQTSLIHKRDETVAGQVVYFRTDLKAGNNQDPKFKNLLLSHQQSPGYPTRTDITFVNQNERDGADRGLVESRGIVVLPQNGTGLADSADTPGSAYLNVRLDTSKDLNLAQRVTYDDKQLASGSFYVVYNELKLGSTDPGWDTWLACDGHEGFPILWWAAAVPKGNNTFVVSIPQSCSAIRIFVDPVGESQSNSQINFCQTVLDNANMGGNGTSQPAEDPAASKFRRNRIF